MKNESQNKKTSEFITWVKSVSLANRAQQPAEANQPKTNSEHGIKYAEHLLFAGILTAALLLTIISVYIFGLRGSLAPVKAASVPLKASMSEEQIKQKIDQAANSYRLAIQLPDGSKKYYSSAETGVSINTAASAKNARTTIIQAAYSRLLWWKPINAPLQISVNQQQLQTFINTHATQVSSVAKDATLTIVNGEAKITSEVAGGGLVVVDASKLVPQTYSNLQTKPLQLKPAKLAPTISADNLGDSKKKVDELLDQQVTFTINGRTITANSGDKAAWIELTPVEAARTVDVTVNSGKILNYINYIAKPYIQPPRSKLVMNTADGQVVLDAGANGIDIIGKDKVAAEISQKLLAGKGAQVDLPVQFAAAQTVEVQPADKWLVIDVTTKRMYAYEQTNLVKSFLISAGAPKTPTVLGKFAIYAKKRIQDMRGLNADGSRYFQPDVPYVNYFYKDYAIHGNYWRPLSYFGNINSSHGCVGIVDVDAAWLYDWAAVGTPVIVHK